MLENVNIRSIIQNRGVRRRLGRQRLENFNFFCSFGGAGWKASVFFDLSLAAIGSFYFREILKQKSEK
jgi:hypothetical protein